jgi:hypothetical protein
MQAVMNFAANGIPNLVLVELMNNSLDAQVKPLQADSWERKDLIHLANHIVQMKQINATRLRDAAGAQARMYGLSRDDFEVLDDFAIDPELLEGNYHPFQMEYAD